VENILHNKQAATADAVGSNPDILSILINLAKYGIKLSSFLVIVRQLVFSNNNAEVISFNVFSSPSALRIPAT
jgi:hypothetical protein